MEFKIILPIKIDSKLSLNRIYSGIHWETRKKQAQKIHDDVRLALMSQHIPQKMFEKPVNITFRWNSRLDLDNHGYIAKLIIDGLKGCLIHDDSQKYISSITHHYWQEDGVKVEISEDDYGN